MEDFALKLWRSGWLLMSWRDDRVKGGDHYGNQLAKFGRLVLMCPTVFVQMDDWITTAVWWLVVFTKFQIHFNWLDTAIKETLKLSFGSTESLNIYFISIFKLKSFNIFYYLFIIIITTIFICCTFRSSIPEQIFVKTHKKGTFKLIHFRNHVINSEMY